MNHIVSFAVGLLLLSPPVVQEPHRLPPVQVEIDECVANGANAENSQDPAFLPRTDEKIPFRWPAEEAARVVGFPSMLIDEDKLSDRLSNSGKSAQKTSHAKSIPGSSLSEKATKTAPFSEVIAKIVPCEIDALSPEMLKRKERIETCLKYHYTKPVNADVLRPWSIMHGILAYGQNSLVVSRGNRISAVDYVCQNGIGNDRRLFTLNGDQISVAVGTGFQGHEGQLLAILGQVQTPIDHPLQVNGKSFTVRDLIEYEKSTCRQGTELTFKLIGLSVYLGSEEVWKDRSGQRWDLSRLMYEEMAQPINGAACGGTHRLMGLSYALAMRRAREEPIDGQWQRAENFLAGYHKQALGLQTTDGGFSTEFFEGLSQSADPIRQIYSTGHCLEWLAISMTDEQLQSAQVTRMVDRLLHLMETEYRQNQELSGTDVGPKGHALRALRLYELRVHGLPSQHMALAMQDPRPVIGAQEIPAIQEKLRVVAPTSTDANYLIQTGSSNANHSSGTMPSQRNNNRFMRRR